MMPRIVRQAARRVPGARLAQDTTLARHSATLRALAPFAPNSAGPSPVRARLALQSASRTFELLEVYRARYLPSITIESSEDFAGDIREPAQELAALFTKHGSDKSSTHDYHLVYSRLLTDLAPVRNLLEVGLGTNNEDVVSHMSSVGRPGASLRAFRDFLPEASIWGADVDSRVLFEEERITTFFVDQTDLISVDDLAKNLPSQDLIIDDGLHSPDANLAILLLAREILRPGGWVVVEDIGAQALPIWKVITDALRLDFDGRLIQARGALLWAGRRLS